MFSFLITFPEKIPVCIQKRIYHTRFPSMFISIFNYNEFQAIKIKSSPLIYLTASFMVTNERKFLYQSSKIQCYSNMVLQTNTTFGHRGPSSSKKPLDGSFHHKRL